MKGEPGPSKTNQGFRPWILKEPFHPSKKRKPASWPKTVVDPNDISRPKGGVAGVRLSWVKAVSKSAQLRPNPSHAMLAVQ